MSGFVLALTAAPVSAATITTTTIDDCLGDVACSKYAGGTPIAVTIVTANPGETNRVTVSRDGDHWVIRDEGGASLTGCPAADATAVRCPVTPGKDTRIAGLRVTLADGDDTLTLAGGTAASVSLGDGADSVGGSDESETIDGGTGTDRLDGGGGIDTLDFGGRTGGVTVDLGAGTTSDGDALAGFRYVRGGLGDDTLRGGSGGELLDGGDGRDSLSGGGGADSLFGGGGADRLHGGSGKDQLYGDDGADHLFGDSGDDYLVGDTDEGDGGYYDAPVFPGNDVLEGGAGNDRIIDPGGRNTVRTGPGNDRVDVRNGKRDRVMCGSGRDRVRADRRDSLQRC